MRTRLEFIITRAINNLELINAYRDIEDNNALEMMAYKKGVHDGQSVFLNELNLLLLEMKEWK